MDIASHAAPLLNSTKATVPSSSKEEMGRIRTLDSISDNILPILTQVGAVLTVGVAGLFSNPITLAVAGASVLAFEVGRAYLHNQGDLNRELALYHKDIARVLGKSPDSQLTIQDMRNAADEKVVGDKALKPLKAELEYLKVRGKLNYTTGVTRAVITTAVTSFIGRALGHLTLDSVDMVAKQSMQIFYLFTGALGISSMANMGMEKLAWNNFDKTKPPSLYIDLIKLQKTAQTQNVTPQAVFEIILKADKELDNRIERETGSDYHDMTARNKERIVARYAGQTHAAELAEHINNGNVGVTAIPLSVSGQLDWSKLPALETIKASETPSIVPTKPALAKPDKFLVQLENNRNQPALAESVGLS